jgi:hypothetical protein
MAQDEGLLVAVEMWFQRHWEELAGESISATLVSRTTTRSKNIAAIEFMTPSYLVTAEFWDSGESEVISTPIYDEEDPKVRCNQVVSASDVETLLDLLHVELRESDR